MPKKLIRYILFILVVAFFLYHSVYFRKLDEASLAANAKSFDAASYARNFYENKLLPRLDSAVDLSRLIPALRTDPDKTFADYSHALDIGNVRYFLVRGEGSILSIGEDAVAIALNNDPAKNVVIIATEFIYGNAIRDASGLISLNEFASTADFNRISEEINRIVRRDVVAPFRENARKGDIVKFSGAIELNQAHVSLDSLEVIPIQLLLGNKQEK